MKEKKLDHRDVRNIFHEEGRDGIQRLVDDGLRGWSFDRAVRELMKTDRVAALELERVLFETGAIKERRGRTQKPYPGLKKPYNSQAGGKNKDDIFLRVPLRGSFPNTQKQMPFLVGFEKGRIVITE